MSNIQTSAWCMTCQRQTLHQRETANHTLHLILTIVTVGLWGIVWLIQGLSGGLQRARCAQCGSQVTGRQILSEAGVNVQPGHGQRAPYQPRQQFPPPGEQPRQFAPPAGRDE